MPLEEREYKWVQIPFINQLVKLGYEYHDPKDLEKERESLRSVLLIPRLKEAIERLNNWLPDHHFDTVLREVIRAIETPAMPDLVACNELVHRALVNGVNVQLDLGEGLRSYTVKLIDFDNPENNQFLVTDSLPKRTSFKVQGHERSIEPDILVFVNGIPLIVVEAKDPAMIGKNPLEEAQNRLERYQRDAPQLFYPNLFVVATTGDLCSYAPVEGDFMFWRDEEKANELGVFSKSQDVFISCIFPKENLLDFLRSFVAFTDEAKGKVKKIARHPQWRAVNNAVKSAWEIRNERKDGRGGTVWHWQGSGKTLTILWLALKLRREFQNPCIIVLTDRIQLDEQMDKNFSSHGYPNPIHVKSIARLREELKHPIGKTLIMTLQKLGNKLVQETSETEHLTEEENIFVIADEAHRSQYAVLAARMRKLLPKATFFAFTGTPLERDDKNTPQVFGSYVDRYTIMDALKDKVTVPILYQPRLPELHLSGEVDIDELLAAYFRDFGEEEEERDLREKLRRLKLTPTQVAQVGERMQKIAKDIVEHFLSEVEPRGFKAMVVAHRRKMAAEYKELVDKILESKGRSDIKTDVVITVQQNEDWARPYQRTTEEEQQLISQFRDPDNPLKILFVSDKLLTGFDAPILQVMYFDKRLREHTLLQAIARVNRPCKLRRTVDGMELEVEKDYGLIVDYFGIASELEDALAKYERTDVEGIYEKPEGLFEQIEQVREQIDQILGFDLEKERWEWEDMEQCLDALEDEDKRKQFALLVRNFGRLLNQILPDPKALDYVGIFKRLTQIRYLALLRYRDSRLKQRDYLPKLVELLNEAVRVIGITVLEPVKVTDEEFLNQLEVERTEKGKARAIISALNAYISEHIHEDPQFYQSLQEQLEAIIEEFKERREETKEFVAELMKLRERILQQEREAERLGLTRKQLPFFRFLRSQGLGEEEAREIVLNLEQAIREVWQRDWWMIEGARQSMRTAIYRVLRRNGIERERAEKWQSELLSLAEQHYRRWD
jgi:type I restriction enzyme R subunit